MVPAVALAPWAALTGTGGVMHERPASRPAGHRHSGPLDAGLSGTGLVADDLYLMAHDDRTGRPHLQPRALGIGLAGALLTELMLAGWIGLRQDSTVVFAAGVTQDTVMRHALLKQIAGEPEPQPVQAWLRFLARSAARDVAVRLEQAGYLQHVPSWVPGRQGRWVPVNPDWAFTPMLRARSALDPARPVTVHAAALTGLAVAAGLGFRLDQYQTHAGRTIQDAVAALGPALQELISQIQTAVDSTVLSHRM
jgi:hypothetical protein